MYEPPIQITTQRFIDDVVKEMNKEQDEAVFGAVLRQEINVDRAELIKALEYDRGQYAKGYADGVREFATTLIEKLDNPRWWMMVIEINKLMEEMVGDAE